MLEIGNSKSMQDSHNHAASIESRVESHISENNTLAGHNRRERSVALGVGSRGR